MSLLTFPILESCAGTLFEPGSAEIRKRFSVQNAFCEREDDAFFFVKVPAGGNHRGEQELASAPGVPGFLREFKALINLLVLLVKTFALADLFEAVFERADEKLVFGA